MKVKILNYQRIKKASLEFVPGLNVIIGQSNNGKSSIIRALETAIYNLSREGHVTLGETKSAVGIEYNDHQIIWRRDTEAASQVTYRVDGKIYGKLGKGQPEVVKQALGISEVEINDKKFKVNFSKQMSYPFLLDATPSELFKFIVQSSEEDNVVDVLNDMRSDVNEIASNVKKYEEARNSLGVAYQREAKRFKEKKPLLPYCEEILKLESEVKKLKSLKETIETYEKCRYVVQKAEENISRIQKLQNYIDQCEKNLSVMVSKVTELKELNDRYLSSRDDIRTLDSQIEDSKKILDSLSDIESYIRLLDSMEPNQAKLSILKQRVDEYGRKKSEYDDSVSEIESITLDIERKEKVYKAVKSSLERIDSEESRLSKLKISISSYKENLEVLSSTDIEISKQRSCIEDVDREIEEIGICPYCGNLMKGDKHEHS